MLALLSAGVASGRTWHVEQDGSGEFTMIQQAVDAASDGDVIAIGPGRYDDYQEVGNSWIIVNMDGSKGLTFVGSGTEQTIIGPEVYDENDHTRYGFLCLEGAVTVRLEHLRVENQTLYGIALICETVELEDCVIDRCFRGLVNFATTSTLTVRNCRFINGPHQAGASALASRAEHVLIEDSDFVGYWSGVNLDRSGTIDTLVRNCRFDGEGWGNVGMNYTLYAGGTVEYCSFTGINNFGFSASDCGPVVFRYNVVEDCPGAGIGFNGCADFTVHDNTVDQCTPCIFVSEPSDAQHVYDNHFFRNESAGGFYLRTSDYYPYGPFDLDFTENYWGTTDADEISQWIYDGHDNPDVLMYVVFEPMADGPVSVEQKSWSEVKGLFGGE